MLAVLLAAASSLGYGVADFVGGLATRRDTVLRVVAVTAPVSLIVELLLLPLVSGSWSAAALAWGALAGVASAAAFALLYQSLAMGPMGVLSPVTAVVSAVLPAAFGIAEGERLSAAGIIGIVLAIAAVIAVSAGSGDDEAGRGRRPSAAALGMAVAAGATIAAMLVCLAQSPHDSGLAPLISCRAVSLAVLLAAAALRGQLGLPGRSGLRLAAAAGLFDAVANVAFLVAVRSGSLVVVAVITALYPGGTVLLARRVLGERLSRVQLTGLLIAAVAVSILAVS
ncbi:MAG TPA: EamA family transporter [Streptosporangiaceae bacterium]|nr:EamA family transporter [Streptosporangiaceae bacterium]